MKNLVKHSMSLLFSHKWFIRKFGQKAMFKTLFRISRKTISHTVEVEIYNQNTNSMVV